MTFWSKFTACFRREKLDAEMSEEMRLHLEQRVGENIAAGMSPEEARYAALRKFGGVEQAKERCREQRGLVWLEQMAQDLGYAIRGLAKHRSFTLTAVATLALGIGVNAALFSIYNAIALRPLPVREPEELIVLRRPGSQPVRVSYPLYQSFRDENRTFSSLAAWITVTKRWSDQANPEIADSSFETEGGILGSLRGFVVVQAVSDNYFATMKADMALGRGFLPQENRAPGGPLVIVLQHRFWQRQLQADPNVLGKSVSLNGRQYAVVGVTAADVIGHEPAPPIGWVPLMTELTTDGAVSRDNRFSVIGRLHPGVELMQAQTDLKTISDRRAETADERRWTPPMDRGLKFMQIPLSGETLPIFAPIILGFLMVLLIACTNVANLMLARGITRQQEIAVRLTLGASRGRVLRQLLTENLLLCAIAAVLGLTFAQWTLATLQPLLPAEWGLAGGVRQWRALMLGLDHRVVVATLALVGFTTLATGLLPALQAVRTDLISATKDGSTLFNRRLSQNRMRNAFVVAQVAVSLMLLSCAGLLGRNMWELRKLDLGYEARSMFATLLVGDSLASPDPATRAAARRRAVETVRELPGVVAACQVVERGGARTVVTKRGVTGDAHTLHYLIVSPGYFETLRLPLVRGRSFSAEEIAAVAPVVIVSESAARRLWSGENALGRTLAVDGGVFSWPPILGRESRECTVIGVARDVRDILRREAGPTMYLPLTAECRELGAVYVRPRSDTAAALAEITRFAARENLTVLLTERASARGERKLTPFIVLGWVSGGLGLLALVMAAVGLGGVMAFAVGQRVREIGIRVALGATTARVVWLFLRQGMKLVAIGMGVGIAGGIVVALLLRRVVFGLGNAFDPASLALATSILGTAALLACWLPARRAAKVDPMVALRCD